MTGTRSGTLRWHFPRSHSHLATHRRPNNDSLPSSPGGRGWRQWRAVGGVSDGPQHAEGEAREPIGGKWWLAFPSTLYHSSVAYIHTGTYHTYSYRTPYGTGSPSGTTGTLHHDGHSCPTLRAARRVACTRAPASPCFCTLHDFPPPPAGPQGSQADPSAVLTCLWSGAIDPPYLFRSYHYHTVVPYPTLPSSTIPYHPAPASPVTEAPTDKTRPAPYRSLAPSLPRTLAPSHPRCDIHSAPPPHPPDRRQAARELFHSYLQVQLLGLDIPSRAAFCGYSCHLPHTT